MNAASFDRVPWHAPVEPSPSVTFSRAEAHASALGLDCLAGLSRDPRSIPCKWLYDDAGSQLFEGITAVEEYYPTRVEERLLKESLPYVASVLSDPTTLVELGSGASRKTRSLLAATDCINTYIPIDISADELERARTSLQNDFPDLAIKPICADFTLPGTLELSRLPEPILLFFPGSTLGNMAPREAIDFLHALRESACADARLLLGVDLLKDEPSLCAAYDDPAGITAAFNLNLLARMNRELGSNIDVSAFRHRAVWNPKESRIEMQLEASSRQEFMVLGREFVIDRGETIHTENSYKLSVPRWTEIFEAAGWRVERDWQSAAPTFLLALLAPTDRGDDR